MADTVFFILSKTVWLLVRPETVLVLLFVLALWLLRRGRAGGARRVLSLAVAATLIIGIFPVGHLVLAPLERAYPANPPIDAPAGILVLGGAEEAGPSGITGLPQVADGGDRLIAAMALARRFPEIPVLYSGGMATVEGAAPGAFRIGDRTARQ